MVKRPVTVNAVAHVTGQRLRGELPLSPAPIKEALNG